MKCDSLLSDWLVLTLHFFFNFQVLTGTQVLAWPYFFFAFLLNFLQFIHSITISLLLRQNYQQQHQSPPAYHQLFFELLCNYGEKHQHYTNRLEALPKKPEELVTGPLTSILEWPSLPASQNETSLPASSIPPGQKPPASPIPVSWAIKKKSPVNYERDRVEKYAQYFKGDKILPFPKLVAEVEPKTVLYHHRPKD